MKFLISKLVVIFLVIGMWSSFARFSFSCEFIFSNEEDMQEFIEFVNKVETKYAFRSWTGREINALYKAHRVGRSRGATQTSFTEDEITHKIYMPHFQADIPLSLTQKMVEDGTL